MKFRRRDFLSLAAAAGVLRAAQKEKRVPVALQLFSVRQQCAADLPGTLARVAEMGYDGVELAGYYGRQPDEFKALLAGHRLICCSAHVPFDLLKGDKLDATIRFHEALGNRVLIVPGLPPDAMSSGDAWLATVRYFSEVATILGDHGMRIGYHNHALEFQDVEGFRPWDTFVNHSSSDVVLELDLGNAGYGGANPIGLMKKLNGRARFIHVKDYTATKPDLMIGDGDMNWRDFFSVCGVADGPEWFVIEHDSDPQANLADIADSMNRFRAKQISARVGLKPSAG